MTTPQVDVTTVTDDARPTADGDAYPLRRGGDLRVAVDGIYVDRPGEATVYVDPGNVVEVERNDVDYFLGVLSVVLVGFGLYTLTNDLLAGVVFAAAGLLSCYLTYRKRGAVRFRVAGRAKPLTVYPANSTAAFEALRPIMAAASD